MHLFDVLAEWISANGLTITVIIHISFSLLTSLHIVLFKEDYRTSLAWIGLVVFSPVMGSLLYWFFGINRIKRLAQKEHPRTQQDNFTEVEKQVNYHGIAKHWHPYLVSGNAILPINYLANNSVEPLVNGDIAYPAMLESIRQAKISVALSSYMFDYDSLGRQFVTALSDAHNRGVAVNVLLDGIGISYSWRKSDRALKKLGVPTARFLPADSFASARFINLRNHRKILCIDGDIAYIGGINISKRNVVETAVHPIDDIHFRVTGPVIDQISQVFIEDWRFATGTSLTFPEYRAHTMTPTDEQSVVARVVQDGPDEHHHRVRWTLINALGAAQSSVKIMTPYFIPDQILMTSLHAAALRGVSIEIIVPARSNIPFIDWVMASNFARIIQHGIKIYKNKRPFDHSKIVIIDDLWSLIGSSNWDARSLEFNFEINIECFDNQLNAHLTALFNVKKQNAERVDADDDVNNGPVYIRFRNNLVRLFSPYL